MASAEENVATVRRVYELFNRGNLTELAAIFADDAVWHAAGRSGFAGEKRGREAAFAYFGQLAEATGGTFRAEVRDVVGNGEHVVGLHTAAG